jgi:hypothetical protein
MSTPKARVICNIFLYHILKYIQVRPSGQGENFEKKIVTVSSYLYYMIYLWPDDGLIGAETCSHADK